MNFFTQFREQVVFSGLVFLVTFAPLPLGSNRPLPAAIIALTVGILLLLQTGMSIWGANETARHSSPLVPAFIAFVLVIVWILIQMAPAPWLTLGHPIWTAASSVLGEPLTPRITIDPAASGAALMNLLAYAGVFWLAFSATRDGKLAARARQWLVTIGGFYAAYGILNFVLGVGWLPFIDMPNHPHSAVGTFVNRNNFATFTGLCLLCALSLLLERVQHILSTSRTPRQKLALVIEMLLFDARWNTAATLLLLVALFLSASRAGIASSLAALFALTTFQTGSGSSGKRSRNAMVLALLLLTGFGFLAGGGKLVERIEKDGLLISGETLRHEIYDTTLQVIRTAPLVGTGFGTYATAIETYREDDALFSVWQKAHNSYLETTTELGIPAALTLHGTIFWLALLCFRGVRLRRSRRAFPALGVAATILVGLHALVDFSLQIPAIAILYAFIMGFAVAQSAVPEKRKGPQKAAPSTDIPPDLK
ncbi:MAG: O-antigen ligase family protein [Novosphingobium sp.]